MSRPVKSRALELITTITEFGGEDAFVIDGSLGVCHDVVDILRCRQPDLLASLVDPSILSVFKQEAIHHSTSVCLAFLRAKIGVVQLFLPRWPTAQRESALLLVVAVSLIYFVSNTRDSTNSVFQDITFLLHQTQAKGNEKERKKLDATFSSPYPSSLNDYKNNGCERYTFDRDPACRDSWWACSTRRRRRRGG